MKVAIVFLFLAAVAAADTYEKSYGGYGKQHIDYAHVPYYNSDWQVEDKDYYGKELNYGQKEQREHDNTKTNWWVTLPGNAHIKRDDLINAQMHVSHSYGHSGDYKQPEYKSESYKMEEYKSNDYKKPDQYKADDYKVEEYKSDDYKKEEYKSNDYKKEEYKADDYKQPDQYKADDYKVEEYKADEYKQDY